MLSTQEEENVLESIGLTLDDFYRFRYLFVYDNLIIVATRGGAYNSICSGEHGHTECDPDTLTHTKDCTVSIHAKLRKHPHYMYDEDGPGDTTYKTFVFCREIMEKE